MNENKPKSDIILHIDEKVRQQINAKIRELFLITADLEYIKYNLDIMEKITIKDRVNVYFKIILEENSTFVNRNINITIFSYNNEYRALIPVNDWHIKLSDLLFKIYKMNNRMNREIYLDKLESTTEKREI